MYEFVYIYCKIYFNILDILFYSKQYIYDCKIFLYIDISIRYKYVIFSHLFISWFILRIITYCINFTSSL